MVKRLFDIVGSALGLLATAPLLGAAALGIRLSDGGPVLYRARRMGLGGRPFTMYKLRTMRVDQGRAASRVTTAEDARVFRFGRFLRLSKLDELPQLVNVLRGEMSLVGPRPEEPEFVLRHYSASHWETLSVRPGLASPGSLYHETHCEWCLGGADPEAVYVENILPLKLALELVYVRRRSFRYDLAVIGRTLAIVAGKLTGRRDFPDPPELDAARGFSAPAQRPPVRGSTAAAALLLAILTGLNSEIVSGTTHGGSPQPRDVGRVLYDTGYQWGFLPVAGKRFTDTGEGACHDAPPRPTPADTAQPGPGPAVRLPGDRQ
ncbi:MAG TPA: sugar transferase [Gemmatimonadales bacterium]|jgi:lipopolysaccharide/colanic/teichoic acid biosynthesis glycosyltransferase|nr:sugar transferase [Gemmatimonadales bacterium]